MIRKPSLTAEEYAAIDELVRLGSIAVNDAQNESRRLGVPNVYSINGRIYYETATGELPLLQTPALIPQKWVVAAIADGSPYTT
ncbi:MAG: hypothetical protein R3C56_06550 [Pirellulaceae bacterium]